MARASVSVDFIGHATAVIELDGLRVLTDPATRARIGPLRRVVPVPDRRRLEGIDLVIVSHMHWDHLDLPSLRDLGSGIPIVAPIGSGDWLRAAGFDDVHELRAGERLEVGGVGIEGVRALHSGFRPPVGPTADALGFVLRGSQAVYFAGDTDLFPGMADLAGTVDLALLPVWGWGPMLGRGRHLDPRRAAEAVQLIKPRAVVPIHWGTYWPHAMGRVYPERLVEPPTAFTRYAAELSPDVRAMPTAIGDLVEFRW
jgi:L-ascorbate metabolism protein UlaG (beta-lactamase superfamily)